MEVNQNIEEGTSKGVVCKEAGSMKITSGNPNYVTWIEFLYLIIETSEQLLCRALEICVLPSVITFRYVQTKFPDCICYSEIDSFCRFY
jgi:hypothetical protein